MARKPLRYVVSDTRTNDRTKELQFPEAWAKFSNRVYSLRLRDGQVALNFEDNDWKRPNGAVWLPPEEALVRAKPRLEGADGPGVDAFVRGARGRRGPTYRIRSVEVYSGATFKYSGEMDPRLRNLCEALWNEFGDDNSLSNGGVHVCKRIAGSYRWSQHSWYSAIDLMVGNDMALGDDINRWLNAHEGQYGPYCEKLWRVSSHYDHIHLSLAPCHGGTPPCA